MLAIFLGALDQTIVAVSLPAISAQFQDLALLAWVISGYMVAMTVATPVYGKLGDLYGRRAMILFGMGLFTLASLLCGFAQSMEQLVLARVLQGMGAGGLVSVSQAIIGDVVPPRERGRYQGYFSSMYAAASVVGPVLGGYMTEFLSWRWVFWVNLPLGVLGWLYIRRTLAGLHTPQRRAVVDYPGVGMLVVGLTSLLMAITLVGQGQAWNSIALLALWATALAMLVLFAWHEARFREPLLPLRLFNNRSAVLCWCTVFITAFQAISLTVMVPLRYQTVLGSGADSAALHMLPLAMGLPLGAFFGGRHTARSGRFKPVILAGAALMPLAVAGLAATPPQATWLSALFMILTGAAAGMQFPTSLVGAQNAAHPTDMGVSTSTTNLFRSLGGAVGVACMSALLLGLLQLAHFGASQPLALGEGGNPLLDALGAADGDTRQALREQLQVIFRHLFLASAAVSLLGLAAAAALPNNTLRGRS
ncbi:MDR family MFS transporter [Pseudomonas typographi]|uniref:MFS transporter n=1 Tax=Pseudomonas typographi TaxID=2715964 RepID=A0ABR7YXA8_9PSED|nr:MDR family MFS transporter [Pseudomonas typographi]MBD1585736.1 MFS transporter [Pseudomonas typographi]MBD1597810.1 MFS transporter [Pseudomonas typographi]